MDVPPLSQNSCHENIGRPEAVSRPVGVDVQDDAGAGGGKIRKTTV